jgi:hypothetical protein
MVVKNDTDNVGESKGDIQRNQRGTSNFNRKMSRLGKKNVEEEIKGGYPTLIGK